MADSKYQKILQELVENHWAEKALESLPNIVLLLDREGKIIRVNSFAERILGIKNSELYGKDWFKEFIPKNELKSLLKIWKSIVNTNEGTGAHNENSILNKNGEEIFISWSNARISYRGKAIAVLAIGQDITEKKVLEQALQESTEKYKAVIERATDGVAILQDGKFCFVNPQLLKMFGDADKDVIGKGFLQFIAEGYRDEVSEYYNLRMAGKKVSSIYETVILRTDGSCLDVELNAGLIQYNDKPADLVFVRDISKRKRTEKELAQSNERYVGLFNKMSNAVAVYKAVNSGQDFEILDFNPAAERLEKKSFNEVNNQLVTNVFPGVKEFGLLDVLKRVWKTGKSEQYPVAFYKDEKISGWRDNYVYKLKSGEVVAIYDDVTKRKQAEEALRLERNRLSQIISGSAIATVVIDTKGTITHWNKIAEKITGVKAEQMVGTKDFWKPFYPKKRPVLANLIVEGKFDQIEKYYGDKVKKSEFVRHGYESEDFFPHLGERGLWLFFSAALLRDKKGNVMGAVETLQDITESKRVLNELKRSRASLSSLMSNLPGMAYRCENNRNWTMHFVSDGCESLTGYSSANLLGDKAISYNEVIHPDDRQFVFDSVKDSIGEFKQYEMEYRIITKSGDEKWVWEKGLLIADNSENNTFLEGIIVDITDRKKLEQLLISSEKRYRKLFENMSAGFAYHEMICDEKGKPVDYRYLEVNDEFEVLTGIKKEEVIGKTVCEVLPDIKKDDFNWIGTYGKIAETGESTTLADQYSESLDRWYSVVVYSPEKGTFVTIFLDITGRKKVEEKLKETLGELEASNKELQRLNDFMIGRELRMRELKMRIKELEESVDKD